MVCKYQINPLLPGVKTPCYYGKLLKKPKLHSNTGPRLGLPFNYLGDVYTTLF